MTKLQQLWLDALRSGEYEQGKRRLHDPQYNTYCCLGVACEVMTKFPELKVKKVFDTSKKAGKTVYKDLETGEICSWTLNKRLGDILGITWKMPPKLICMNDGQDASFEEIADYLETIFNPETDQPTITNNMQTTLTPAQKAVETRKANRTKKIKAIATNPRRLAALKAWETIRRNKAQQAQAETPKASSRREAALKAWRTIRSKKAAATNAVSCITPIAEAPKPVVTPPHSKLLAKIDPAKPITSFYAKNPGRMLATTKVRNHDHVTARTPSSWERSLGRIVEATSPQAYKFSPIGVLQILPDKLKTEAYAKIRKAMYEQGFSGTFADYLMNKSVQQVGKFLKSAGV